MKLFFSIALIALHSTGFSQSVSFKSQSPSSAVTDKWDLNKFVWSQTHASISKNEKPPLDFNAIDNWDYLDHRKLSISADGSYFAYGTRRGLSSKRVETLIVQSITGTWRKSYMSASRGCFSADGRQYIFKDKDDLYFLHLGSDQSRLVKQVESFKQSATDAPGWIAYRLKDNEGSLVLENLFSEKEKKIDHVASYEFDRSGKWLTCQLNNDEKQLLIYNLKSESEKRFPFVEGFAFCNNGGSIVIKTVSNQNGDTKIELRYITLPAGEMKTIWSTTEKGISVNNYCLDSSGRQVVFTVANTSAKELDNSIWYYKEGMGKAALKVSNQTADIIEGLSVQEAASFTESGRYIQFSLQAASDPPHRDSDAVMVDVWNHKDSILQSTQSILGSPINAYKAVLNPETDSIIRLENENEKIYLLNGDFAVVQKRFGNFNDRFWEEENRQDSVWLLSLKKGVRRLLLASNVYSVCFSPAGKYLVYLDVSHGCHYFSIDLHTGKSVKISNGISDWKLGYQDRFMRPIERPAMGLGIPGWLEEDAAVLVYDNYDIWKLDLTGKKAPVCITNGYGQKHHILFCVTNHDRFQTCDFALKESDTLLLTAFNIVNKKSGFYQTLLESSKDPDLIFIGANYFQRIATIDAMSWGMPPIRASNTNVWIVQKESSTEAPGYFLTKDFKTYKPLTNFQSQKNYNWLTTELHSFKQLDGTISNGILYKPENFNPSKKYPVIISFYSSLSSRLFQFPQPKYMYNGAVFDNPAWMVSHGYLVFLPDIYFTKGQWGTSAVNTVVGAANYLTHLPYVDSKRLGACGHSNSGRLGYYLFTHSTCFAAMSVSSGTADIISSGLQMEPSDGSSSLNWAESGSFPTGLGSLWKNKAIWLDHTSVLHTDNVTSPLLIFQSKQDPAFSPAFEMFTALRRLEKKAWWLQYDKGGHNLTSKSEYPNELKDYTIRYTQFYDHFLRGAPAPLWMTEGIPYQLKGIESRLELDTAGKCSNKCKICLSHKKGS